MVVKPFIPSHLLELLMLQHQSVTVEYVVVAGGGGAGADNELVVVAVLVEYRTGVTIISGPSTTTIQGAGGAHVNDNTNNPAEAPGIVGTNTVASFPGGTVTAGYGGAVAGNGGTGPNPFQNAPWWIWWWWMWWNNLDGPVVGTPPVVHSGNDGGNGRDGKHWTRRWWRWWWCWI